LSTTARHRGIRASRVAPMLVATLSAFASASAHAQAAAALHEIFLTFDQVSQQLTIAVGNALGTHEIETVVNVLYSALALGLFVWRFAGFALRGFNVLDLMTLTLTLFFVYILLTSYKEIIPPIFEAGAYVANLLGNGISGITGSTSMAESIFQMITQVDFSPSCSDLECLGSQILSIPASILAYVLIIVLGIIATLVELWTSWGFEIAYAVGWLTVPCLLLERLSFLFDGWLKFFFGMIVYVVVAKVNLALVLLGLEIMFGVAEGTGQVAPVHVSVGGFFDVVGMVVFMVVGIASLYSTGRFASSIVNSAGGGGIGEIVQKAASTAATIAGAAVAVL
jgi:hypothetical protein